MVAKSEPPSLVMCPLKKETSLWKTPFKRSSEQPVIAFYCTDVAVAKCFDTLKSGRR